MFGWGRLSKRMWSLNYEMCLRQNKNQHYPFSMINDVLWMKLKS